MQMGYNFPQIDLFYIIEFQFFAFLRQNQISLIIIVMENNYKPLIVMALDDLKKFTNVI